MLQNDYRVSALSRCCSTAMSKSMALWLMFVLSMLFSVQSTFAQCADSPAECQNNTVVGHGPDQCLAKVYCSNSGAVESGLIACTNSADTDGCGINASVGAFSAGLPVYDPSQPYADFFDGSSCSTGNYLQWTVFATPPTVKGTKIQAVGAVDSWFLFYGGSFTIDGPEGYTSVFDALSAETRCDNFDASSLVTCSDSNQYVTFSNDNAVTAPGVYNVYYIAFFYDAPTRASLNFKIKDCEIVNCPQFVSNCPDDVTLGSCVSQADVNSAYQTFLNGFSVTGGSDRSVEWFVNDVSQGSVKPTISSAPLNCGGAVKISYTATDSCNIPVTCEKTFTVTGDSQPPTLLRDAVVPPDMLDLRVCLNDRPLGPTEGEIASLFEDNCSSNITVIKTSYSKGSDCKWMAFYDYTIVDDCGNAATPIRIRYQGRDTQAPIFDNVPEDVTVNCDAIPESGALTATDNCDADLGRLMSVDNIVPGNCPGNYTINRSWTATDDCGNSTTVTQVITVKDDTAPVIDPLPEASKIECTELPVFAVATATDNCDNNITLTSVDTRTPGECDGAYIITRTWTATDNCGNSSTASQEIYVEDNTPPVFEETYDYLVYECVDDILPLADLAWTDNCDGSGTVPGVETFEGDTCYGKFIRTWTYTDSCGNTATTVGYIIVRDTTAPVIDTLPIDTTIECSVAPAFAQATATDNCGGEVSLTSEDVTTPGECDGEYSVTRTWTATDDCGNSSTATQTINVEDNTAPVINALPIASTIECPAAPSFATATASDLCSAVTLTFNDVTTPGECDGEYSVTRTWTATDDCGNSSTATQTINVEDNTAPVINALPVASTIECPAAPSFATATASDLCSEVTLTFNDVTTPGECDGEYSVTRTWTATDDCGNSSTATQTINVEDNTAPTLVGELPTGKSDINACFADAPEGPSIAEITALFSDSCSAVIVTKTTFSPEENTDCQWAIVYRYDIQDSCGNFAIPVKLAYNGGDMSAPVLTGTLPEGTTGLQCLSDNPGAPALMDIEAAFTDNCGTVTVTPLEPVIVGDDCGWTATYTYTVQDACENFAKNVVIINSGADTTPPMLVGVLPPSVVNSINLCKDADLGEPSADDIAELYADNCSNVTVVKEMKLSIGSDCEWIKVFEYTAIDACDNEAELFKITYSGGDTEAPEITVPTVGPICDVNFPSVITAEWTDNCSGQGKVDATVSNIITNGCIQTADYVFTVSDACGNVATETLTVTRETNVEKDCETAFARDRDVSRRTCFIPDFSRWGWTNQYDTEGVYTLDFYAGAAHCDISNRTPVGEIIVDYTDGFVTVTYNIFAGYTMTQAHLYIGCEMYPSKNNKFTVAPGQYNFNAPNNAEVDHVSTYSIGPIAASGTINVIAHGVVCTAVCECSADSVDEGVLYTPTNANVDCGGDETPTKVEVSETVIDFIASPVPFDTEVFITYNYEFDTDVTIELYDTKGVLIQSKVDNKYKKGSNGRTRIDLSRTANQLFYVKVVTNKGSVVKKIVSSSPNRRE